MLTLYHAPQSRSSRVLWLLEELNAPYDIVYVDIPRMRTGEGAPDPRNPHPDKKVPALVHDGALITESPAIFLYLTDLYPDAGIGVPVGDPLRGPYLSWLAYCGGVIEPVISHSYAGLEDNPVLAATFRGRAEMDHRILAALEGGPHLLGERFSGADILISAMGLWARQMVPAGAKVDAWLERCAARPALARANAKDAGPG